MQEPPLFKRLPGLRSQVGWLPLGAGPTPVRELPVLARRLGLESLWLKDDAHTDAVIGGNKVRGLEFILPAVLGRERPLLAIGPVSSNWVRAASHHIARLGATCEAILFRRPSSPACEAGEAAIRARASRVTVVGSPLAVPGALLQRWREHDRPRPVLLPPGGSSPLGSLGYVNGLLELVEDVAQGRCPAPSRIIVAMGSTGTAAGLLAGLALTDIRTELWAVRTADLVVANALHARWLARRTCRVLERGSLTPGTLEPGPVRVLHEQLGPGYGRPTPQGREARALVRDCEGLTLDLTYTAKAMAALVAAAHLGLARDGVTLFWSTLGHPLRDGPRVTRIVE